CFVGSGFVFDIGLSCPAPKCDAFLVEPGNLYLSRGQCISVTCANRWPDISSKHDAQSGGQNTNGYEDCSIHVVYSNSTFECTLLINNRTLSLVLSPIFSPEMGWMKFLRVELRIFSSVRLGTRAAMFFDHGERLGRVCHSLWRRISPWWPSAKRGLLARDVVQQRRADHAAANRGFHG